jgi:hypothetical protein
MKTTKTFESAVSRQIEKLQSGALCELEWVQILWNDALDRTCL